MEARDKGLFAELAYQAVCLQFDRHGPILQDDFSGGLLAGAGSGPRTRPACYRNLPTTAALTCEWDGQRPKSAALSWLGAYPRRVATTRPPCCGRRYQNMRARGSMWITSIRRSVNGGPTAIESAASATSSCERRPVRRPFLQPQTRLAEQRIRDAETHRRTSASRTTRGPSTLRNGRVVVESIDKVLSVDVVANPATTAGLFESYESADATPPAPPASARPLFPRPSTKKELIAFRRKLAGNGAAVGDPVAFRKKCLAPPTATC